MAETNYFSLAHMLGEFRAVLSLIEATDSNYALREALVYRAVGLARALGLRAGVRFDKSATDGPDWPIFCIELPEVGEVSWHCPAYTKPYSGYSVEEKYRRLNAFLSSTKETKEAKEAKETKEAKASS